MTREPMTRRYPYWRVTITATVLTIIVCLLAGAGIANAAKPLPRHTDDGSGWGFCVGSVPPPGWTCY
jgi:hypothetical protein